MTEYVRKRGSKVKCKKRVEVGFDGGRTTSDGGLVLLPEVDPREGLRDSIVECIEVRRDSRYVRHHQCELIRQRVYQIAMSYEGWNDANSSQEVSRYGKSIRTGGSETASLHTSNQL